eukprot:TRINITY_DN7834_c0_g2_i1.p1 TRINITY_DN7834_c0_g2~~TRINITY_DN7834_c0_g2_i1.p1  ORF type:complete len:186 (-),score=19.74 TRINITY_DN7834_c0_g2_i1:861-1418(-)
MASRIQVSMILLLAMLAVLFSGGEALAIAKKCHITWQSPIHHSQLNIYVGTTCTWEVTDSLAHCVKGRGAAASYLNSPVFSGQGTTWSFKFTKVGLVKYDCCLHLQQMTGSFNVVARTGNTTPSPPPPCVKRCQGRCWGGNGCGGSCAVNYPKAPNKAAKCNTCCKQLNTNQASITKCKKACNKS